MLELTSHRWKKLSHAYGSAEDIPELIELLKTAAPVQDYKDQPWFSIWSSLCHQSDVYTATYAAIPHVMQIATTKSEKERLDHLSFIVTVEAYRHRKTAPPIPGDLEQAYFDALKQTEKLIVECLKLDWRERDYALLLGGFAIVRGEPRLGNAITELPEASCCPKCNAYVPPFGYDLNE